MAISLRFFEVGYVPLVLDGSFSIIYRAVPVPVPMHVLCFLSEQRISNILSFPIGVVCSFSQKFELPAFTFVFVRNLIVCKKEDINREIQQVTTWLRLSSYSIIYELYNATRTHDKKNLVISMKRCPGIV